MACKPVCGSTTGCARDGSLWNRALLFNIFFAAVINVTYTRYKADKNIMDALVHLKKKKGARGSNCRKASPGDAALGHALR